MDEAKTKGVGFMNAKAFTVERFGIPGWTEAVQYLGPHDRAIIQEIVPVGWYSLALYARLIRAIDKVHGTGDIALVVQLGRFEAERDLTTIHRVFLRLANPAYAFEKAGEYWRRFHDTGHWVLVRESPTRVRGELVDWGCVDHALCRELIGYMGRMLELVGAHGVLLEHLECRARGDPRCIFVGRWQSRSEPSSAGGPASPPAGRGPS